MLRPSRMGMAQYGLAYLGVHLSFMPLLVLLVPRRMEAIGGAEATSMLSWVLLTGAMVAGASHIAAGHISDRWLARHGTRRGLIGIGVVAMALSYGVLALGTSFAQLLVAIWLFQVALNCAFAPLGALLADHFPHQSKGLMGGIMHAALPASSLAVVLVGNAFPQDGVAAFLFAGAISIACFAPLLLFWRLGAANRMAGVEEAAAGPAAAARTMTDFGIAWAAKLSIQLGATFVHGYIYLFLAATIAAGTANPEASATSLLADISWPAGLVAIVVTLAVGVASDRAQRRRVPLAAAAAATALGLLLLSEAGSMAALLTGYCLFYVGLSAFTSLDTALVAQLVSGHPHRGTLLGLMNLTNTLPSVIAPAMTLLAFQTGAMGQVLGQLFLGSAGLALAAGIAILFVRTVR